MIITDKLIFLEMEKTGTTHINDIITKCYARKLIGKHTTLDTIPDCERHRKFIAGSIRNPWDWYVSLWAQGCRKTGLKGGLYERLTNRKLLSRMFFINDIGQYSLSPFFFPALISGISKPIQIWEKLYSDYTNTAHFRKWLKLIYDERRIYDLGLEWPSYPKSKLSNFMGLMSYRYCTFFIKDFLTRKVVQKVNNLDDLVALDAKHNLLNGIVKVESLEADLIQILVESGHLIDCNIQRKINDFARTKINASKRLDTSLYYDQETLDLISTKEKFLINKYSYKAPQLIQNY